MIYLISILIILFLIIPVYIVIPMSFSSASFMEFPPPGYSLKWYEAFFTNSTWTDGLTNSIIIGVLSTILALIIGIMAAQGLVKTDLKCKKFLENIYRLPMVIPAIIIAIAVYRFESQSGIAGTKLGIICAHTLLELPYVISTIMSRLTSIDSNYENAALNLGASKFQAFLYVIFPMIKPAILSSAMFAFSISFDEAVISLFVAGVRNNTLPRMIYECLKNQFNPSITTISSIVVVVITIIMIVINSKDLFSKENR